MALIPHFVRRDSRPRLMLVPLPPQWSAHESPSGRAGQLLASSLAKPAEETSLHGKLHWNVFGALVFALSPVSCLIFLPRFRAGPCGDRSNGRRLRLD